MWADTTWDFTSLSETDSLNIVADINAGSSSWGRDASTWRYYYSGALTSEALKANSTELAYTSGLLFTCTTATSSGKLRINVTSSRFELNGTGVVVTIPNLTAGQTVTVSCKTANSDNARGLYQTNLTSTSNFDTQSNDAMTCTGTVASDGSVTLTTTDGGMYLYYIKVTDASSSDSGTTDDSDSTDDTTVTTYNTDSESTDYNQAVLTLMNEQGTNYYNTSKLSGISISDDNQTVTVNGTSFTDIYENSVKRIDFTKALSNGEVTNEEGTVTITEAKGWFECAYALWEPFVVSGDTCDTYNVYVKGGNYSDYTLIDEELVRYYGTYYRADVLGLTAATDYELKIVPVSNDSELEDNANAATGLTVKNYSRQGFAHFGYTSGVGAYNDDGSLKSGARVYYVTADNAKTISCDIVTSSSGSTTTFTGWQQIIYGYQKGYDTTPITFRLIGLIDSTDVDEFLSTSEGLQIKGKNAYSTMNITIEGVGDDATVRDFGFLIRNCTGVELRNFAIMLCMDDAISIDTDNSHVWIHNMDLFYGSTGSDSDQAKGDGTVDIKGDSQYITVYNNHFWDNGKSSLCGMTSETGPNYITYHNNWFDHSDSRHPRIRTMSVHIYNNYFDGNSKYGVGVTLGSSAFVDRNYFRAAKYPMLSSMQGSDTSETFSGEDGGIIKAYGNYFTDNQSSFKYVTYQSSSNATSTSTSSFDAYEVSDPSTTVPSTVVTVQGNTSYDNFDTDESLMYSYTAMDASLVADTVTGYWGAGRLNHGDFEYTISGDSDYSVDSTLKSLLTNYTSSLGGSNVSSDGGGETSDSTDSGSTDDSGSTGDDSSSGSGSTDTTTSTDSVTVATSDNTVTIYFTNSTVNYSQTTSASLAVTGNYSTSKGSITINGTTYSTCIKMESSTSLVLTADQAYTMTLVFNDASVDVKIDGTTYSTTNFVYSTNISAGTVTITKSDAAYLFAIILTPTGDTTTDGGSTDGGSTDGGSTDDDGTTDDSTNNGGTTDDDSSDTGDTDNTATADTIVVYFDATNKTSSNTNIFSVTTGSYTTSYGTATYGGTTYTDALKMESSTSATLTLSAAYEVTFVFSETQGAADLKIDGTTYSASSGNTVTVSLSAGSYAITKASSAYLFVVALVSSTESTE